MHIAVVGAGLAGVTAARALHEAGHAVQLFDKSRGVGGRMSTRRTSWTPDAQREHALAFDHGAPSFTATDPAFAGFIQDAATFGWVAPWAPRMAPGSRAETSTRWVASPDMPALCRRLAGELPLHRSATVTGLARVAGGGWQVLVDQAAHPGTFDRVVLAMPPAQAAALLQAHAPTWAMAAREVAMTPCWTVMAVFHQAAPEWDAAAPSTGPVAWAARQGSQPGRDAPDNDDNAATATDTQNWVIQASAAWSAQHLEDDAATVSAALLRAFQALPGLAQAEVQWHTSHRWRYSVPRNAPWAGECTAWTDDALGLGVCGDWLGGVGVEGAWLSAQALAEAWCDSDPAAPGHCHPSPAMFEAA